MKVLKNFSNHFFSWYQKGLDMPIKGCDIVFDYDDGLYYRCHKVHLNYSGSNIDSRREYLFKLQ